MKIRAVGAELFHAEGRTDMTKLMVAFRNYRSAPVYDWTQVGGGYTVRFVAQYTFIWLNSALS
jgi:hypothetical protein